MARTRTIVGTRVNADGSSIRIIRSRPAPAPAAPPIRYLTLDDYQAIASAQNASIEALADNVEKLIDLLPTIIAVLEKAQAKAG
jgi:hypothetical protein